MNIIYFNGDSFTNHRYFRENSYDILSSDDKLIINNSIEGNWNTNIVKQTIKELHQLSELAEKTNGQVYAFIFFSELLRSPFEIKILDKIVKTHETSDLEFALAKLAEFYYLSILLRIANLKNVCVHISTAFTDLPIDTKLRPMYEIVTGVKTNDICYTVSYISKHGDQALLDMGFNKTELLKLIDSSIKRCDLLNKIPDIYKYHFGNKEQYKLIINSINQLI